ncbi:MAG: hypothetical protein OEQ39_16415 [Gammaproteobacteria bacterium]|nr:hypothetical protein [Gammaproteobacteria bacterium]MDH3468028.1 hypothetical protein [Gammaproteobacteria bacterium]
MIKAAKTETGKHFLYGETFALLIVLIWSGAWPASIVMAADPADPLVAGTTFTFRDIRTPTQTGFFIGDRIAVGVLDVKPNPENGSGGTNTEATASQGDVSTTLEFFGGALGSQYVNSVPFQPSLTGSFEITITNPGSVNTPLTVVTPSLGSTSLVPFATDGQLLPNGLTPRVSWTIPTSFYPDSIRLFIFDLARQALDGSALVIHAENLSAASTFYDIPAIMDSGDSLQSGGRYEIAVMLQKNRADGSLLSRSRRFYQFSPVASGSALELPSVGPDNIFRFDFDATKQDSFFLDPPPAFGYQYDIGPGDPKFQSIRILTDLGSDYMLTFKFGPRTFKKKLAPGDLFDFSSFTGIESFEIRLLRPKSNVQSDTNKLFLSEVSFVSEGTANARFTGTMTPITVGNGSK